MKIDLLGGVNEIGGNKILLEHDGTRILLDFGMSFGQSGRFFSEFLQPRKCSALGDFFELGLLPDLKGAYREDYIRHMEREPEDRAIDALLLSHAHADHAQYIHFLRFDIPVYCTQATKIILQSLEATGSNQLSDLITACEAFTFYTNKKGNLSRVTRKNRDYVHERDFRIMGPESRIRIGSLEVEMVPVDHSLPGACGFIIYSDEGNLVYTGDIRFHGSHAGLSESFVEKAAAAEPRWLITEGTRISSDKVDSEEGVREEITRLVSKAGGMVFVEHPIRDLDRVNTIFSSAKANNREFVVTLKLAYLIREMGDIAPFSLSEAMIHVPRKSWGLIGREGMESIQIEQDYRDWEKDFIGMDNAITSEKIRENPGKYVVSMGMWEINQLADIRPEGAIWIKSSCEPFCDDMELDEERKMNWLDHFGIGHYSAHASGHASGREILEMIRRINPREVIPVHTEHPELVRSGFSDGRK